MFTFILCFSLINFVYLNCLSYFDYTFSKCTCQFSFIFTFIPSSRGSQHLGSKTKNLKSNSSSGKKSQQNDDNSTIIRLKECVCMCLISYMYLVSYTALETT